MKIYRTHRTAGGYISSSLGFSTSNHVRLRPGLLFVRIRESQSDQAWAAHGTIGECRIDEYVRLDTLQRIWITDEQLQRALEEVHT